MVPKDMGLCGEKLSDDVPNYKQEKSMAWCVWKLGCMTGKLVVTGTIPRDT